MKVLITGAAGLVGRGLRREFAGRHELKLLDLIPINHPEGEMIVGSVTDREVVHQAVKGVDGIIHLAMGKGKTPRTYERTCFDVHLKAAYYLLEEGLKAGVRRAVYASTLSVYGNWPKAGEIFTEMTLPVPSHSAYSLTKYMAEEIFHHFALQGLSSVSLRLTMPTPPERWEEMKQRRETNNWSVTHIEDVAQAFRLALERDGMVYEVFHIAPEHAQSPWDVSKAKSLLGYRPMYRLDVL